MPILPPQHEFADPCSSPDLPAPLTGGSRSTGTDGVFGANCAGGNGVFGHSPSGVGVRGESDSSLGVFGRSQSADGIQGRSSAPNHAGVSAVNESNGFGIWASSQGGEAGHFEGNVVVTGDVILKGGQDVAERFRVDPGIAFEPGYVMVMTDQGRLEPCDREYDKRAVGVISGGGALRPAITLGTEEQAGDTVPIALIGTAYCFVDATDNPVDVGDMLTTSEIGRAHV